MTEPGSGSMQVGPNGLESLILVSPSGDHEFRFVREPSGAEHYARRSGEELDVKTSPNLDGPATEYGAAVRLRDHLEETSPGAWSEVIHVDGDECDCVIRGSGDREDLRVQIVRADVDESRWRFMRSIRGGRFYGEDEFSVAEAIERLAAAVEKKESRYGPETRRTLVLLLDAYNVPEASITSVKVGLRRRVLNTGFRAIWVAGASASEVWLLR